MPSAAESRLRFIRTLDTLHGEARAHLLRVETQDELGELFNLAVANGYTDVAASIAASAKN